MTTRKTTPAKKAPAKKAVATKKASTFVQPIKGTKGTPSETNAKGFLLPITGVRLFKDPAPVEEKLTTTPKELVKNIKKLSETEKIKVAKAAIIESSKVINNFIKLLNMYDKRHESFRQIDMNDTTLTQLDGK